MAIIHTLYAGVTQSGKTTLARSIARQLRRKKQRVIVYDPMLTATAGGDWGTPEVYETPDEFLTVAHSDDAVNCHLFIDEAHHIFAHTERDNMWLLTQGRHYGMTLHLITQRPNKIHPDARSNCGVCYMFRLAQDDARAIGNDYGFSDVHKINLDKGDFLLLNSGSSQFSRANIFQLLE
jgi:DNA helicase HerA-like ATPase